MWAFQGLQMIFKHCSKHVVAGLGPLNSQRRLRGPVPFVPVSDAPAMTCCGGAHEIRWVFSAGLQPWWTPGGPPFGPPLFSLKPQDPNGPLMFFRDQQRNSLRLEKIWARLRWESELTWISLILPWWSQWIMLGPTNLRSVRVRFSWRVACCV